MNTEDSGKASDNQNDSVGVLAKIDAHAPTGWKATFALATIQLFAGTEKGAVIYGKMRARLDDIEGRSVVNQALARAVADQAIRDPEVLERAKARFLGTAQQKQENLEAVISGAGEHLLALPAPDTVPTPPEQKPTESEEAERYDSAAAPLNPDWAASFTGLAENATTEELRDRLSRVLAGELSSPGRYSRATVRAIAELERSDLEAMRAVLPYVLGPDLIRTEGANPSPDIEMLLPLAEAGLVADANPMLSKTWGPALPNGEAYIIGGVEWAIIIQMIGGRSSSIPIVPLTRTGNAVVDLLGRHDERLVLRRIARQLDSNGFNTITMGRKVSQNQISDPYESLYPEPTVIAHPPMRGLSPFGQVTLGDAADVPGSVRTGKA